MIKLFDGTFLNVKETPEEITEQISYAIAGGNLHIELNEKTYAEEVNETHYFKIRVMIDKIITW